MRKSSGRDPLRPTVQDSLGSLSGSSHHFLTSEDGTLSGTCVLEVGLVQKCLKLVQKGPTGELSLEYFQELGLGVLVSRFNEDLRTGNV